jgi:hypothetical protein
MREMKQFDNHLGIIGWLGGGRWGFERYLYILHRVAGLGILLFFMMHIFESSVRIFGPERWNAAMGFLDSPVFKIGEFVLYRSSLNVQRPLMIIVMVIAAVVILAGGMNIFVLD